MKTKCIILASVIVLLFCCFGCGQNNDEKCIKGSNEKQYAFLDDMKRISDYDYLGEIEYFYLYGYEKFGWVRDSANLKKVYSSFKKIGLKKFISDYEFNVPLFTKHWEERWKNKSLNEINKELVKSYADTLGVDEYYIGFWNRRRREKNESVLFKILNDIDKSYNPDGENTTTKSIVWNDEPIITKLYEFEVRMQEADSSNYKTITLEYCDFLQTIGLHSSANNLLYNANLYQGYSSEIWDKDYLLQKSKIEVDTVPCYEYRAWRAQAIWFSDPDYRR